MNILTVTEVSEILDISGARVRRMIADGLLKANKFGKAWAVDKESVERRQDIQDAQKAWRILGIPPRVWGGQAFTSRARHVNCGGCDRAAWSPGPGTKYSSWAACPNCGWAEKGENDDRLNA